MRVHDSKHVGEQPSPGFRLRPPGQALGDLVEVRDACSRIGGDDGIADARERHAEQLLLGFQDVVRLRELRRAFADLALELLVGLAQRLLRPLARADVATQNDHPSPALRGYDRGIDLDRHDAARGVDVVDLEVAHIPPRQTFIDLRRLARNIIRRYPFRYPASLDFGKRAVSGQADVVLVGIEDAPRFIHDVVARAGSIDQRPIDLVTGLQCLLRALALLHLLLELVQRCLLAVPRRRQIVDETDVVEAQMKRLQQGQAQPARDDEHHDREEQQHGTHRGPDFVEMQHQPHREGHDRGQQEGKIGAAKRRQGRHGAGRKTRDHECEKDLVEQTRFLERKDAGNAPDRTGECRGEHERMTPDRRFLGRRIDLKIALHQPHASQRQQGECDEPTQQQRPRHLRP